MSNIKQFDVQHSYHYGGGERGTASHGRGVAFIDSGCYLEIQVDLQLVIWFLVIQVTFCGSGLPLVVEVYLQWFRLTFSGSDCFLVVQGNL